MCDVCWVWCVLLGCHVMWCVECGVVCARCGVLSVVGVVCARCGIVGVKCGVVGKAVLPSWCMPVGQHRI